MNKTVIHPQDWSLDTMYHKLTGTKHDLVSEMNDGKIYLDFLEPKGKIILDVGAYNGDSARLFLKHGAKQVIAIEKDLDLASKIKLQNCIVFAESFDPEKHLSLNWDAAKVDIEGYEILLLPYLDSITRPMLVEVHNRYLEEKFASHGFKTIYMDKLNLILGVCLMGRDATNTC